MPGGVHAQVALEPGNDCPLGRVIGDYAVQRFIPAGAETPPQVVLDAESTDCGDGAFGDASLLDVELTDDDGLTVGGGGILFRRDGEWTQESTPTGANFEAVIRGRPGVAVGASGTVVEHR